MKLTPSGRLYALGTILLVALSICSRTFADRGGPYFMAASVTAGIAYLLAVRELFAAESFDRRVIVIALAFAAVWQLEFLRLSPGTDDDIHRYVWDGRLQRLGYNPYLIIPSDPAVNGLHTPETRQLNNPDLPSPYPPGAQLFFRGVMAIHESVRALKIAFFLCSWGIVFLLLDLSHSHGNSAHLALAYAWNPLLAIEVAGSGHVDILGALLLVLSVAALARHWRAIAAVALGLAIAVKFLPIVVLPLYWKRIRLRDAGLAMVVVTFLYVPFLNHGRSPIGSLAAYVQGFRFNGPVFAALTPMASPQLLAGLAVFVGMAVAIWLRSTRHDLLSESLAWPMAASLLCAPVVFPWYLLWLVPFLRSAGTLVIAVWTISILPVYLMWHWRALVGHWGVLPVWVMLLEYGFVGITAVFLLLRRRVRLEVARSTAN